ncbi:MAG TPA: hypothetical protein VHF88_10650 [Thermoleophilaceae bacterium]|nr:hypothetical protein [Thermoleophilaceae bacterium]
MSLRNETIGFVVGIGILIVGVLLTSGDPDQLEGALIALLMVGVPLWLSYYLHLRDGSYPRSSRR